MRAVLPALQALQLERDLLDPGVLELQRLVLLLDLLIESVVNVYGSNRSFEVAAAGNLEVTFSPSEGSEALVDKVVDSARTELHPRLQLHQLAGDGSPVARKEARCRRAPGGRREEQHQRRPRGKARAALSALVNADADVDVDVRTISVYPIQHDKVIVADRETVELGSFNYSDATARRNREYVLVNWRNPKLAAVYLAHFERNYQQASRFQTQY